MLRRTTLAILASLSLALGACQTGLTTTNPPAATAAPAAEVHLRATQAMTGVELLFDVVTVAVEASTPSLTPPQAATVQTAYRRAHDALLAARAAYRLSDDATAVLKSQEATDAIGAINVVLSSLHH